MKAFNTRLRFWHADIELIGWPADFLLKHFNNNKFYRSISLAFRIPSGIPDSTPLPIPQILSGLRNSLLLPF